MNNSAKHVHPIIKNVLESISSRRVPASGDRTLLKPVYRTDFRLCGSSQRLVWPVLGMGCFAVGMLGLSVLGCDSSGSPRPGPTEPTAALSASGISADELFQMAMDNLEHLEKYQSGQMLQQVVERLNQWIKFQTVSEGWQPDPLASRLPEAYQQLPSMQQLAKRVFPEEDGYVLLAALWSRDLAKWVVGRTTDELQQAERLFDWTVRNIQLQPTSGAASTSWRQLPWETLLLGRGSSLDRAWVFILLARQLGIEAFVIGLAQEDSAAGASETPWAVGVLQGKEIYVFDPALGLPIPGPEGLRKGADGSLEIRPATLRQLADNPLLLRRLDLGEKERYPAASVDLARAVGLIAALPAELSVRMQMVESRLVGAGRMSLAVRASEQADRLKAAGGLREVKLWTRPLMIEIERLERSHQPEFVRQRALALAPFEIGSTAALWRGRVSHLRGNLRGEQGATYFYHQARPPESELNIAVAEGKMPPMIRDIFLRAKMDASYWLGLLCFDLGQYPAAIDYFQKRTLEPWPDTPWKPSIHYNLGRTYEALGQYEQAIRCYEAQPHAPDGYGRRLRARWIKEYLMSSGQPAAPKPSETSPSEKSSEKPSATSEPAEKPSASAKPAEKPSATSEPSGKPPASPNPTEKDSNSAKPVGKTPASSEPLEKPSALSESAKKSPASSEPTETPPGSAKPAEKPAKPPSPPQKPEKAPAEHGTHPAPPNR